MGGMSLILTSKPVSSRHLSGLLGLIGPIANASWTHSYAKQCIPPHPPHPTVLPPANSLKIEISTHL